MKKTVTTEEIVSDTGELCTSIYYLAAAISSLSEIDTALLGKPVQARLSAAKNRMIIAITHFSEKLPGKED